MLGEGVWGRTWLVEAADGQRRVLKLPYEPEDLPPAAADKIQLMRACAKEQAKLLADDANATKSYLVPLEDKITLPSGATALLLPYYPTTLDRQLRSGVPLTEALRVLAKVAHKLQDAKATHDNLRPSNILIDPAGEPVLMDVATPSMETLAVGADRSNPERRRWAPADRIAKDTWSICQALYCAAALDDRAVGVLPEAPAHLNKVSLAEIRDRIERRLRSEGANSRFITRTAERLGTLLGRGLSKDADPSPPYRFLQARDLAPRLTEVVALVDPGIDSVGKLLLASSAQSGVFHGPGPVGFTVSVAPTEGVQDAEDVVCGLRLTDLDTNTRVPIEDAQFTVDRHASGRLRYAFNLPDVAPGRYEARVAFSIKDSGHEPTVVEGSFEVRPPAGYVPPAKEQAPSALSFPGKASPALDEEHVELAPLAPMKTGLTPDWDDEDEDDAATVLMSRSAALASLEDDTDPDGHLEHASDPGGELIEAFPRPLAPTGAGTQIDDDDEPEVAPRPMFTPRPLSAPQPQMQTPRPMPPPLMAVPTPAPSEPGSSEGSENTDPSGGDEVSESYPGTPPYAAPPTPTTPSVVPSLVAPMPMGHEPPGWQSTQEGESDFFGAEIPLPGTDAALPGAGGEDLVDGARSGGLDAVRARAVELANGDPRVFYGAVIAGCLLLVLITVAVLKACA